MDPGSILADPCFVDMENRDFRLKEVSHALALSFQPIKGFQATDRKGVVRDE